MVTVFAKLQWNWSNASASQKSMCGDPALVYVAPAFRRASGGTYSVRLKAGATKQREIRVVTRFLKVIR
jgi:hypothetical protein